LIECKQSQLPYVFFPFTSPLYLIDFPQLCGVPHLEPIVMKPLRRSAKLPIVSSVLESLDLSESAFVRKAPIVCGAFCRVKRQGKQLELTGTEAYQGVVLPLLKALKHYRETCAPARTAQYFDCTMTCAVAVLDAPMVIAAPSGDGQMSLKPWVRVIRHEPRRGAARQLESHETMVIDVIHRDYVGAYVEEFLLPFAKTFSQRIRRYHKGLAKLFMSRMREKS
jgi:hypothetical protein